MNNDFEAEVLWAMRYFSLFRYPPNFEEIYTFLKKKTSKRHLAGILEKMEKKGIITVNTKSQAPNPKLGRYTLGEYGMKSQKSKVKSQNYNSKLKTNDNKAMQRHNNWEQRYAISLHKLRNLRFRLYLRLLSLFPQIKLVGLSGTLAMMNAKEQDDIDLFIVTAKKRLFTSRFIALVLTQLFGFRRKRQSIFNRPLQDEIQNKVCLNLFFDESNLQIPKYKQTEYVAHEVLQMKPLVQKDDIYMRFIDTNRWVFDIFPNAEKVSSIKYQASRKKILNTKYLILNTLAGKVERWLKSFQLYFIKKHQTSEIITDTQLWFFPQDFELKLKKEWTFKKFKQNQS